MLEYIQWHLFWRQSDPRKGLHTCGPMLNYYTGNRQGDHPSCPSHPWKIQFAMTIWEPVMSTTSVLGKVGNWGRILTTSSTTFIIKIWFTSHVRTWCQKRSWGLFFLNNLVFTYYASNIQQFRNMAATTESLPDEETLDNESSRTYDSTPGHPMSFTVRLSSSMVDSPLECDSVV